MSDWVFVDIPANAVEGLDEAEFPFPIRREQMAAYEELRQEGIPVVFVADELDLYLAENPNRVDRYRKQAGQLFLCAATDLYIDHCYEEMLHYFKLVLWLNPGDLDARLKYAASLSHLGHRDQAIEQYRTNMAKGHVYYWWHAWMLCARALMEMDRNEEALKLLQEAQQAVPEDDLFWVTLAACKEKVEPRCPKCGQELKEKMRFCGNCGARLEAASATT